MGTKISIKIEMTESNDEQCMEPRKELGIYNSSAIGEKMNDLVAAERQKHNGMSWSKNGSVALASITSLKRNNEDKKWFEEQKVDFYK